MTDPAIIAASYAAEKSYTHNLDDVIDASDAVGAWGTTKESTTELVDLSGHNNIAAIEGAMPTEGFIQGRRYGGIRDYLASTLGAITDELVLECIIKPNDLSSDQRIISKEWDYYAVKQLNNALSTVYFDNNSAYNTFSVPTGTFEFTKTITHIYVSISVEDGINIYANGIHVLSEDFIGDSIQPLGTSTLIGKWSGGKFFNGINFLTLIYIKKYNQLDPINNFNTLARLPFWSVNYTDYPDNVAEYTDNLPYSSSIISSGTFKVDDDKLQCVSAGTIIYSASYEFDGSEYIKIEIDGVEYAGTGTITHGNTTVSVAQGSNKVTIVMGTGDTTEGEIGIQFREEV